MQISEHLDLVLRGRRDETHVSLSVYLYPYLCLHLYICIYIYLSCSGKESATSAEESGDAGSILGSKRCPRGGHGNSLQYSCLENPMDRGDWRATVHGVVKSQVPPSAHVHTHYVYQCLYIFLISSSLSRSALSDKSLLSTLASLSVLCH